MFMLVMLKRWRRKKEKKEAFFFKCHIGLAEKGRKEDILQFCQREELLKQKPLNIDRQQGYMLQAYSSPALFHNQHSFPFIWF